MPSPVDAAREHLSLERPAQAEILLRRYLQRAAGDVEANRLMGLAMSRQGRFEQALFYFDRALAGATGETAGLVYLHLGNLLLGAGRGHQALEPLRRATELLPRSPDAWSSRCAAAMASGADGGLDEAISAGERARTLAPDQPHVLLNLGSAYGAAGDVESSVAALERAAELAPRDPHILPTLLMASNYDPARTPAQRAELHRVLGARLASLFPTPMAPQALLAAPRRKTDRLRVGYLSFDLRRHVVAVFMRALLAEHDREHFELFAYQTGPEDDVSRELATLVDHWVSAREMSDEQLVKRLRHDRLDILIDLSGHTDGSRPGVLAMRGAPIQATYMGYPNTTGLPTVDYRIVDGITDPPGSEADTWSTERLVRLPRCFLAFSPCAEEPRPQDARDSGAITFGSFNNAAKINPPLLRLWARVLMGMPGSRLLIKNKAASCAHARQAWTSILQSAGIGTDRIEFRGWAANELNHLAAYHDVDVALDTFPYHGTTTTCEALWMGVPVVSLAGAAHVSRVGASLLAAAGLEALVAEDEQAFVAKAIAAARDTAQRARWRRDLRARVRSSDLGNARSLAQAMESAYRRLCSAR